MDTNESTSSIYGVSAMSDEERMTILADVILEAISSETA